MSVRSFYELVNSQAETPEQAVGWDELGTSDVQRWTNMAAWMGIVVTRDEWDYAYLPSGVQAQHPLTLMEIADGLDRYVSALRMFVRDKEEKADD